ncbi:hypothetical protein BT69DRAFT_1306218, partial [Atractiella rhizophila]
MKEESETLNGSPAGSNVDGEGSLQAQTPELIRAYAKLEFPNHNWYIKTTSVSIGRALKSQVPGEGALVDASDEKVKDESLEGPKQPDVDLGPIKAVSRDHARLFWDASKR